MPKNDPQQQTWTEQQIIRYTPVASFRTSLEYQHDQHMWIEKRTIPSFVTHQKKCSTGGVTVQLETVMLDVVVI